MLTAHSPANITLGRTFLVTSREAYSDIVQIDLEQPTRTFCSARRQQEEKTGLDHAKTSPVTARFQSRSPIEARRVETLATLSVLYKAGQTISNRNFQSTCLWSYLLLSDLFDLHNMTQTDAPPEVQDEYEMGGGPGAPTPVSSLVVRAPHTALTPAEISRALLV